MVVVQDGEVVHRRGYGRAHLEWDAPIAPDTVFHVASLSKQFTALADRKKGVRNDEILAIINQVTAGAVEAAGN